MTPTRPWNVTMVAAAALALTLAAPVPAHAQRIELAVYAGPAFPTYSQQFRFDPGPITIPGTSTPIPADRALVLDAQGGVAVSGSVALYLTSFLALEGRLDTTDVDLKTSGAVYRAQLDLPAPLPDALTALELGSGVVDVDRITPWSINLKLRTPGPVRFTVSGGASYLPSLHVNGSQSVRLTVTDLQGRGLPFGFTTSALHLDALPNDAETDKWGWNLGAGVQIPIGKTFALVGEGRYIQIRRHTLQWRRAGGGALGDIEDALLDQLEESLQPLAFNPTFFQAVGGVSVSF